MNDDGIDRNVLMTLFLGEAGENLAAMEEALVALEAAPDDRDLVDTVFRGAHTLKGNAATLDVEPVVELAHLVEDLLDNLRAERFAVTPGLITLLLRCVDALEAMINAAAADPDAAPAADPALLDALRQAITTGVHVESTAVHATAGGGAEKRTDTLRVSLHKLDAMMNLAGEVAIVRGRLRELVEQMKDPSRDLTETVDQLDRLSNDLQEQITGVRMVPVQPVFQQQVRIARDIARAWGKSVQVRVEGEDVELDTAVVDQIRDPLVHMVRNAIDHGIEDRERRIAAGKAATGTIVLRAYRDGGMVVIQIADDGAGIDTRRVAERARASGLTGPNDELSTEQVHSLLFRPGFSTATSVTELSGRGVGMDVVHRNISGLRGAVSIESVDGKGTTVTIRLPLTLAIIDALSVGVGTQTFVVPLDSVVECLDVAEHALGGRASGVIDVRGNAVPFVRLAACLGVEASEAPRRSLLLVRSGDRHLGVVVDRLHSRTQAVIKPLRKPLARTQSIAGATILGNGSVALIIDLPQLLRQQLREAV
jgi:two-component system, chemotaxis family, sensor kinase CheA